MSKLHRNNIIRNLKKDSSNSKAGNFSQFLSWQEAKTCFDGQVPFDYVMRIIEGDWPEDAFSVGQLASKLWLVDALKPFLDVQDTVVIQACWFGQLAPLIADHVHQIYGFDADPEAIQLSEEFCQPEIENQWTFKAAVADINLIDWSDIEIDIQGELVEIKPNVIINTSTEHMSSDWYHSVPQGTFLALQGNSDHTLDGHVNAVGSYSEWSEQFPMETVCEWGAISFPTYTRYMKIGEK